MDNDMIAARSAFSLFLLLLFLGIFIIGGGMFANLHAIVRAILGGALIFGAFAFGRWNIRRI